MATKGAGSRQTRITNFLKFRGKITNSNVIIKGK